MARECCVKARAAGAALSGRGASRDSAAAEGWRASAAGRTSELTRLQDAAKASEIEAWLDQVAASWNVLPMGAAEFRCWAQLMHGRSDTLYEDAMIAAMAMLRGLTVVTRNESDFRVFDVKVLNPFCAS